MTIRSLTELALAERRVLCRVDFNCPLADGAVADDTRIRAALPTIRHILTHKGRLILVSHLGRPKGTGFEAAFSMAPVAERLSELLDGLPIILPEDCVGDAVRKLAHDLHPGQVMLLENVRFHAEEQQGDEAFAQELASLADVYINDAFGTAHRGDASVAVVPPLVPERGAGFLLEKEVQFLRTALAEPARPFVAILGGAKIADKLPVVDHLLGQVDAILVGGGMAYTFLKARGIAVGNSLLDETKVHACGKVLERAELKEVRLLLPVDHRLGQRSDAAEARLMTDSAIPAGWSGFDIGPKTVAAYTDVIATAQTIIWNGPMGYFENPVFADGTMAIARAVAANTGTTIIGGGDSVAALERAGVADRITHISTGGGASLELLEGKVLPGVKALEL